MINFNPFELCLVEKNEYLSNKKRILENYDDMDKYLYKDIVNLFKIKLYDDKTKQEHVLYNGDIILHNKDIYIISFSINKYEKEKVYYEDFGFYKCIFNNRGEDNSLYFEVFEYKFYNIKEIFKLNNYSIIGNIFINTKFLDIINIERTKLYKADTSLRMHLAKKHYMSEKSLRDLKKTNLRMSIMYYYKNNKSYQSTAIKNLRPRDVYELSKNNGWHFIIDFKLNNFIDNTEITPNTLFLSKIKDEEYKTYLNLKKSFLDDECEYLLHMIYSFYVGINEYGVISIYSLNGHIMNMIDFSEKLFEKLDSNLYLSFNRINKENYKIISIENLFNNKYNEKVYEDSYLYYIMNTY